MRIGFSALFAISALLCAASPLAAKAPLGIYYSFDTPASDAVIKQIQVELGRILAPSGLSAAWKQNGAAREQGEGFPGIVVLRFSGRCALDNSEDESGGDTVDSSGQALAETDTINGHVLPFAKVNCDRIRAFIAPALRSMPPVWKTEMMGRALARVSAHEIYHMLAGVESHGDHGIFKAGHSRRDLTATTFSFAPPENNWLRGWLQRQAPVEIAKAAPDSSGLGAAGEPTLSESDSADFAGR